MITVATSNSHDLAKQIFATEGVILRDLLLSYQCTPKKFLLDKTQHTALQQFRDISKLNSQADLYCRQTCNDVKCSEIPSYSSITQQYSLLSIQFS
jgi:hypothetical protein